MLATIESRITIPSQINTPMGVKVKSIDDPIIESAMIVSKSLLIGKETPIARVQVIKDRKSVV